MTVLTHIIEAEIKDTVKTLEGKVLSSPALLYTDGINVTYACDVDVGQEGPTPPNGDIAIIPLRNVPIASNNRELIYAEVGSPVTLTRNTAGAWEVTGFAKTVPNVFTLLPVTVPVFCYGWPSLGIQEYLPPSIVDVVIGEPIEIGLDVRALTYGELSIYGVYGVIPYGAVGVFQNGTLIEIR